VADLSTATTAELVDELTRRQALPQCPCRALRAVLDLHVPGRPHGSGILRCMACRQPVAPNVTIPCDTVAAIAEALGIDLEVHGAGPDGS
jgi:hypothetical protein